MPKVPLDLATEFGARADKRLREETIGWLVTVSGDGRPQPKPVWFTWDGQRSSTAFRARPSSGTSPATRRWPFTSTAPRVATTS
ncbi:MAG TPA: pyridoxamine 5'-phosphate oxidase family protein [Candidatus Dormibacteraeota bacterium]|jgi:hypothetical protein